MKTSAIFSLIAIALSLNLNAANNDGKLNNETTIDFDFLATFDVFDENAMDVSDWMFDVDAFLGVETDFEEDNIEVEEWMFSVTSFSDDFEEEIRPIEDWMFNF